MVSTVDNLYHWTRALHGGRVLSASSYRRMTTPEGAAARGEEGYGYGLERGFVSGHPYLGHDGWVPGYVSEVMYFPKEQITVVVLENTDARGPLGSAPIMASALPRWRPAKRFRCQTPTKPTPRGCKTTSACTAQGATSAWFAWSTAR